MVAVTGVDYRWTLSLSAHRWPWLVDRMGRTVFEGQAFGGVDPVVLLLVAVAAAYWLAWKRERRRWLLWRPWGGFVLSAALIGAVFLVHGVKWTMGRARPDLVVHHGLAFSEWYAFGPHFITDGVFRGSFPSGHTAEAFVTITLAYLIAGASERGRSRRLIGAIVGLLTIGYAVAVGVGRCMALSHWVSDVVGAVAMVFITVHLLYVHVLRVPDQQRFIRDNGGYPPVPVVWELRMCWHLGYLVLGIAGVVIGFRGWLAYSMASLGTLVLPGAALIGAAVFFLHRLYGTVCRGFGWKA
jgi:membrane-associated phospholipid phosphatase